MTRWGTGSVSPAGWKQRAAYLLRGLCFNGYVLEKRAYPVGGRSANRREDTMNDDRLVVASGWHEGFTSLESATESVRAFGEGFKHFATSDADATKAVTFLSTLLNGADWKPYRARWARKRVPKYLAKGGVRR